MVGGDRLAFGQKPEGLQPASAGDHVVRSFGVRRRAHDEILEQTFGGDAGGELIERDRLFRLSYVQLGAVQRAKRHGHECVTHWCFSFELAQRRPARGMQVSLVLAPAGVGGPSRNGSVPSVPWAIVLRYAREHRWQR